MPDHRQLQPDIHDDTNMPCCCPLAARPPVSSHFPLGSDILVLGGAIIMVFAGIYIA
jgi:hypothetical protein